MQTSPLIANRGYRVSYRLNGENICPGCSRSNWYVGRVSAECAFCSTAVPLATMCEHVHEPELIAA